MTWTEPPKRPLRWHDGLTVLIVQGCLLLPLLPLKEKGFPLAAILGAFLWALIVDRWRGRLLDAVRFTRMGKILARPPMHLVRASLYTALWGTLIYGAASLRTALDVSQGWSHPILTKSPQGLIFGAGCLGGLIFGAHFLCTIVGMRAAFLFRGRLPADAGDRVDDRR